MRSNRTTGFPVGIHSFLYDKTGGHESWQLIVDNPAKAGLYYKDGDGDIESQMTTAELAQYGYTANLMNDVHMSHAMEFGYPQSMRNCATCHDGKLSVVLADANFQYETCISCHPVTGGTDTADADGNYTSDTTTYALTTLANAGYPNHSNILNASTDCTTCHSAAGGMPTFAEIHTGGYDPAIYTTTGDKYAEDVTVTIDSVALSGTSLTIAFSAASTIAGVDAADIVPSVYVAAYGYDTKDFIISNHGRDADGNRLGEYTFGGDANPYFTNATASGASWSVTYDISAFDTDSMVTDGVIKRVEVAVAPSLEVGDVTVGLNAVSTTFNLEDAAVEAGFFGHDIADANSCNTCHDQLATTFHSPDRGGSITVCRMCHVTTSGGSHLEMQSRSIDSYVHAIHTFQPFDTDDIDFSDPFEQMEYDHHIGSTYPMFTTTNCESCHNSDKYNVPDQSKSLPGLLSAAGEWSMDRDIGAVPSYVNGPASRACGSCHRSEFINADEAGKLASFNAHTKTFGFLEENQDGLLNAVIDAVMAKFQ
ncbi:multiheme c-type cytochrome [Deferribacteres bacterium DY0609]